MCNKQHEFMLFCNGQHLIYIKETNKIERKKKLSSVQTWNWYLSRASIERWSEHLFWCTEIYLMMRIRKILLQCFPNDTLQLCLSDSRYFSLKCTTHWLEPSRTWRKNATTHSTYGHTINSLHIKQSVTNKEKTIWNNFFSFTLLDQLISQL